jgi:hypothetical protein
LEKAPLRFDNLARSDKVQLWLRLFIRWIGPSTPMYHYPYGY